MSELDAILGSFLLGTWVTSMLFCLVLVEANKYFRSFPDDPWRRKGLVILVLSLCAVALVGDYATTYYRTVTFWGQSEGLTTIFWSLRLASFTNTVIATIVQSYLIHRLYTLSRNLWATLVLYALQILALGGYMVVFILQVTKRDIAQHHMETIGASVNFIVVAVVDLLTAGGLIWELRSMSMQSTSEKTKPYAYATFRASFLDRIVGAIQTGSLTAACSLLILAAFLLNSDIEVSAFLTFQIAPLYTLTLLFNFNLWRADDEEATASKSASRKAELEMTMRIEGIFVRRNAIVTLDPINTIVHGTQARLDAIERGEDPSDVSDVETLSAGMELCCEDCVGTMNTPPVLIYGDGMPQAV
ncbi:hypothetical protein DFH06DRAFT_1296096 [Mycena polygramma]|nr:hypothetical protein DFH06DRAFT_1296096 [Mycena polygramma]